MASRSKNAKSVRRSVRNVTRAARNARQHGELAVAAGKVVAKRMSLATEALTNPLSADHAEFSRILPEKAVAFTSAGVILASENVRSASHLAGFMMQEWLVAGRAAVALATASSPLSLARVQSNFIQGWWERAFDHATSAYAAALETQSAASAPVRRAALKNARRLAP